MELGKKIMPTNYFIAFLALSIALHFLFPIKKVVYPPYTYAGFIMILFGAIMNLWTDRLFKENNTTVKPYLEPTSLITSGPFSLSRHPMYLGMASVLLGVAVNHGTIITFVFPLLFVILMEILFIPFEEETLIRIYGVDYRDYQSKVRRWI
jgi:protein-S-isoprenylcysteine O-methyltransferase Ste14